MKKHFPSIRYLLVGLMLTSLGSNLFSQKKISGFWDGSIEYQCPGGWKNSSSSVLLSTSFGDKVTGVVMGGEIEINTFFRDNEYPFEIKGQNGCIRSGKLKYREFSGREYLSGEWSSSGGDNAMWGTGLCCRGKIDLWRDIKKTNPSVLLQPDKVIKQDAETKAVTKSSGFDGQLIEGQKYLLKNVLFEISSDVLLPEAIKELDKLYNALNSNPSVIVQLEGHTDVIGSHKSNLSLSKRRVKAAKTYLMKKGIASKRIKLKWYGDTRPLLKSGTTEERKINRRVELTVLKSSAS